MFFFKKQEANKAQAPVNVVEAPSQPAAAPEPEPTPEPEPDPGTTNPDDTDEPASGTGNEADDGKASDYQ